MKSFTEQICQKCHFPRLKTWKELTAEQKFLVEKLPASANFSLEERKKHRFCERCWFEEVETKTENV